MSEATKISDTGMNSIKQVLWVRMGKDERECRTYELEILTALLGMIQVFLVMTPCRSVRSFWRSEDTAASIFRTQEVREDVRVDRISELFLDDRIRHKEIDIHATFRSKSVTKITTLIRYGTRAQGSRNYSDYMLAWRGKGGTRTLESRRKDQRLWTWEVGQSP
jgi:hypothetical protein